MRQGMWRPETGWRAFSTELIVVVLGVLIALAAEQSVSWLRRQGEVESLQSALKDELSDDLTSYRYRFRHERCVANRLSELKKLRDRALTGAEESIFGEIGRPPTASLRTSVWTARSSEVMDAMPLDQRIAYSYLYDELAFNFRLMDEEREAWRSLARFNKSPQINREDTRTISENLWRADKIDEALRFNEPDIQKRFIQLGIRPSERMRQLLGDDDGGLCDPLSR